jgi:excinuclease UvrABC helicase subunit UvrB
MDLRRNLLLIFIGAATCCPGYAADQEFTTFWAGFKEAIRKNDKNAIADMTKLPFVFNNKQLKRAEFIAQANVIFPAETRKYILRAEEPAGYKNCYGISCGVDVYLFTKENGKYKFTEIGPESE